MEQGAIKRQSCSRDTSSMGKSVQPWLGANGRRKSLSAVHDANELINLGDREKFCTIEATLTQRRARTETATDI